MKIKIERSGGFSGIISSKEINTDNLPSDFRDIVKNILTKKVKATHSPVPRGAADHLNYKITIEDGNDSHVIESNEYDADEKLKSLISYVEKKSSGSAAK